MTTEKELIENLKSYGFGDVLRKLAEKQDAVRQGGAIAFYYLIDELPKLKREAFGRICERITEGQGEEDGAEIFTGTGLQVLLGEF